MNDTEQPMDDVHGSGNFAREEQTDLEKNVKQKSTWMRLLFMLMMGVAGSITVSVTGVVVLLNFFYVLFTGRTNHKLTEFGEALASYLYQIIRYLTFNTETRPFPVDSDWPSGSPQG